MFKGDKFFDRTKKKAKTAAGSNNLCLFKTMYIHILR